MTLKQYLCMHVTRAYAEVSLVFKINNVCDFKFYQIALIFSLTAILIFTPCLKMEIWQSTDETNNRQITARPISYYLRLPVYSI